MRTFRVGIINMLRRGFWDFPSSVEEVLFYSPPLAVQQTRNLGVDEEARYSLSMPQPPPHAQKQRQARDACVLDVSPRLFCEFCINLSRKS